MSALSAPAGGRPPDPPGAAGGRPPDPPGAAGGRPPDPPGAAGGRPPDPPGRHRRLQRLLLAWYHEHRRDLPWRRTRDPYAVLVSELMLQQTQVPRVEPAYHAFLARFPTVAALAAAPTADVLRAWQGLGYNRRALNLQRAAQAVVERHGGRIPADLDALEALPGVGPYTARAVLAFAFEQPAAPVDTNVARILARAVAGAPLTTKRAQELADRLVPDDVHAWSQALMDLGATFCAARARRCASCPLVTACAWRSDGGVADPAANGRPRPQSRFQGSVRFHRGRLLDALRLAPVPASEVPTAAHLVADRQRALAVAETLVADGLARWEDDLLRLPE